jgi:hypothetical protein
MQVFETIGKRSSLLAVLSGAPSLFSPKSNTSKIDPKKAPKYAFSYGVFSVDTAYVKWTRNALRGHVYAKRMYDFCTTKPRSHITNSINPKSASTAWSKHILARSLCQAKGAANG